MSKTQRNLRTRGQSPKFYECPWTRCEAE